MSLVLNTNASGNGGGTYSNHLLTYGQYPDFNQILIMPQFSSLYAGLGFHQGSGASSWNQNITPNDLPIVCSINGTPINAIGYKLRDQTLYTGNNAGGNIGINGQFNFGTGNSTQVGFNVYQTGGETGPFTKKARVRFGLMDQIPAGYTVGKQFQFVGYMVPYYSLYKSSSASGTQSFNYSYSIKLGFDWGVIHTDGTITKIGTVESIKSGTVDETWTDSSYKTIFDRDGNYMSNIIGTSNGVVSQDGDRAYVDYFLEMSLTKISQSSGGPYMIVKSDYSYLAGYKGYSGSSMSDIPRPFQISLE